MFFKRSKRKLALFCGAVLALTVLSACGKEPAPEAEAPALPEPEPEAVAPAQPEIDSETLAAFQQVLINYKENLILPDGTQLPEELREFGNMENNTFFIADVDEDGKEELVLEISEAPSAGQVCFVIGYNAGELSIQLQEHCGVAFYPGGIATVIASHNQTMGELWPYAIFRHNPETDHYDIVGNVYAEDHDIMESYGSVSDYHYEADPNNTGTVYFVSGTDDFWNGKAVDIDGYNAWRETFIPAGTEPIAYERLTLTEENIAAITAQ